jgi:hypothetical protein
LFEIGSNKSKKHILHVEISVEPRVYDDAGATATFARGELLWTKSSSTLRTVTQSIPLPSQKEAIEETIKVAKQEVARAKLNKTDINALRGVHHWQRTDLHVGCGISLNESIRRQATFPYFLSALGWPEEKLALLTTRLEESNIWWYCYRILCCAVLLSIAVVTTSQSRTNL